MQIDHELPRGFQDADFEEYDLAYIANVELKLRKQGICTHGFRDNTKCLYCGRVATSEELDIDRKRILAEYL